MEGRKLFKYLHYFAFTGIKTARNTLYRKNIKLEIYYSVGRFIDIISKEVSLKEAGIYNVLASHMFIYTFEIIKKL